MFILGFYFQVAELLLFAAACVAIYQIVMVARNNTHHPLRWPFIGYATAYTLAMLLGPFQAAYRMLALACPAYCVFGMSYYPLIMARSISVFIRQGFFAYCLDGLTKQTRNDVVKRWAMRITASILLGVAFWYLLPEPHVHGHRCACEGMPTPTYEKILAFIGAFALFLPALGSAAYRLYVKKMAPTLSQGRTTIIMISAAILPLLLLLLTGIIFVSHPRNPVELATSFGQALAVAPVVGEYLGMATLIISPVANLSYIAASTIIIVTLGRAIRETPAQQKTI